MPERTVAIGFFAYKGERGGVARSLRAWQGDTVDLSAEEAERGDAIGAFVTSAVASSDPPQVVPAKRGPGRPRKNT